MGRPMEKTEGQKEQDRNCYNAINIDKEFIL